MEQITQFLSNANIEMNATNAILGLLIFFVVTSIIFAMFRGATKSKIRVWLIVISIILAFVSVILVKSFVVKDLSDRDMSSVDLKALESVPELKDGLEKAIVAFSEFIETVPELAEIGVNFTMAAIAPILFLAFFLVFSIVTWLIYFLVTLILMVPIRKANKKKHFRGFRCLINGTLQGILIFLVFFIPVATYVQIAEVAIPPIMENMSSTPVVTYELDDSTSGTDNQEVFNQVLDFAKSPIVVNYQKFGGNFITKTLTKFSIKDGDELVKTNILDEIKPIADISVDVMQIMGKEGGIASYGEAEAKAISNIGQKLNSSKIVTIVASNVINSVTDAWMKGETFMGIAKPEVSDAEGPMSEIGPMLDEIIAIFNESSKNSENLGADIVTIADVIGEIVKADLLSSSDVEGAPTLIDKLGDSTVVTDIASILGLNPRLKMVLPMITDFSIKTLASQIGISQSDEEAYFDFLNSVADEIKSTKELEPAERVDLVKVILSDGFKKIKVEIDVAQIDIIAVALVDDFGDFDGEITTEFIMEFFKIFAEMNSDGENEKIAYKPNSVQKIDNSNGYTYPKYAQNNGEGSAAKAAGVIVTKINEICSTDKSEQEKKDEVVNAISEVFNPVYESILDKSSNKEEAQNMISSSFLIIKDSTSGVAEQKKESAEILTSFASPSTATINCVTVEKLLIGKVDSETLTQDECVKQGAAIETVVKCASKLLSKDEETPLNDVLKDVMVTFGETLDILADSEVFGKDKAVGLFEGVITSSVVTEMVEISDYELDNVLNVLEKGDMSYSNLMGSVFDTVNVIIAMKDSDNVDVEVVKQFIQSLNDDSIDAILVFISTERFMNIGLSQEKISATTDLFRDMFKNLVKYNTEEDINAESTAVQQVINVAIHAKSASGSKMFGADGRVECTAYEFISKFMNSKALKLTVHDSHIFDPFNVANKLLNEDKDAIMDACQQYYDANKNAVENANELKSNLEKFAGLMGVVVTIK